MSENTAPSKWDQGTVQAVSDPLPQVEVMTHIPLDRLYSFTDHPFKAQDDEAMQETVESVKGYSVLTPAIVRLVRKAVMRLWRATSTTPASWPDWIQFPLLFAAWMTIPPPFSWWTVTEDILPSERAQVYNMKLETLKRCAERQYKNCN